MKPSGASFDGSWRDACTVAPISRAAANWMIRRHYLSKWPGAVVLRLGLWREAGRALGCIVFALPPRETGKRYGGVTWELARLWVDDAVPRNAETFLIAQAERYIRRNHPEVAVLVSYADPSVGHEGTIYKAANYKPDGRTDDDRKTPRVDYADAATGKHYSRRSHVPKDADVVTIPRVSKHRYVKRLRAWGRQNVLLGKPA